MSEKVRLGSLPLLVAAVVLISTGCAHSAPVNALLNGGFESSSGWVYGENSSGVLHSWNYQFAGEGGNLLACEEDWYTTGKGKHGGTRAWYVAAYSAPQGGATWWQEAQVVGGTACTATAWAYADDINLGDGVGFQLGAAGPCVAKLVVTEYRADGSVAGTHNTQQVKHISTGYEQLSYSFTLAADTVKVRFALESYLQGHWSTGGVYWDDCALMVEPITPSLTGTVTSNGAPLAGVLVSAGGLSTTTGADGKYDMGDISTIAGTTVTIKASMTGYEEQSITRAIVYGPNVVDFDLNKANLLANPGFEMSSGWVHGQNTTGTSFQWNFMFDGQGGEMLACQEDWYTTFKGVHSGSRAWYVAAYIASQGHSEWWQEAWVTGGTPCTASTWVFADDVNLTDGIGFDQGDNGPCYASLVLTEYGGDGSVLAVHDTQQVKHVSTAYEKLSYSLTLDPRTVKVRFALDCVVQGSWSTGGVYWDDCVLTGTGATPGLRGTVTSGGVPLSGALVTMGATSITTGADGKYDVGDISSIVGTTVTVRASKDGYYAQATNKLVLYGPNIIDFDLVAVGNNLVTNAGFDDGVTAAWQLPKPGVFFAESSWDQYSYPTFFKSGHEAAGLAQGGAQLSGFYQVIPVQPSSAYSAKVWAHSWCIPGGSTAWGSDPSQKVSLTVEELDSLGRVIVEQPKANYSSYNTWRQLTRDFTTSANTRAVRLGVSAYIVDYLWMYMSHVTLDSFELNGAAGAALPGFFGQVTSGGTPLAGATVEALGTAYTTTTGADGRYELSLPPGAYTVRASKPGYYAARRKNAQPPNALGFDLPEIGDNLVANATLEDGGWQTGFTVEGTAWNEYDAMGPTPYPWYFHSGQEALDLVNPSPVPGASRAYQDIDVLPGTNYTASVWARPAWIVAAGSSWGAGNEAALKIQEFDSGGNELAFYQQDMSSLSDWSLLERSFQTTPNTSVVRISCWASFVENSTSYMSRAEFDDLALRGPAGGPLVTLTEAKDLPDGSAVRLEGQIVSAAFSGYFYIETADRSSGIKVTGTATAGQLVGIVGRIQTIDGERTIVATQVTPTGTHSVPAPLGMNNRGLAGSPSPVGLYVKAWGNVTRVDEGAFYIDDGAGLELKVQTPAGYVPSMPRYVSVIGALGSELSGGSPVPVLRAVSAKNHQ